MSVLIQEVVCIYPLLNPATLSIQASNRACNALALLQCVASHQETRAAFLSGKLSGCEFTRRIWLMVYF